MTINSAAEFLKPQEREYRNIEIDGLGEVRIRTLLKSELCKFQSWLRPKGQLNADNYEKRDLWLIVNSVVDENDKTYLQISDFESLGKLNGPVVDELAYEVKLLNGYALPVNAEDLLGKS